MFKRNRKQLPASESTRGSLGQSWASFLACLKELTKFNVIYMYIFTIIHTYIYISLQIYIYIHIYIHTYAPLTSCLQAAQTPRLAIVLLRCVPHPHGKSTIPGAGAFARSIHAKLVTWISKGGVPMCSLLGEMIQFDSFIDGLKPPTSLYLENWSQRETMYSDP